MSFDLPAAPTEITAGLLTAALRDGGLVDGTPDVEVRAVHVDPLPAGTAFLGQLARLDLCRAEVSQHIRERQRRGADRVAREQDEGRAGGQQRANPTALLLSALLMLRYLDEDETAAKILAALKAYIDTHPEGPYYSFGGAFAGTVPITCSV